MKRVKYLSIIFLLLLFIILNECKNSGIISAYTIPGYSTMSYASNIIGRVYGEVNIQDIISCVENGKVYIEKGTHEHIFVDNHCYCGEIDSSN